MGEDLVTDTSFASLYESWLDGGRGLNFQFERDLANTFRDAWQKGDAEVRALVLHYILLRHARLHETAGLDLIVAGLKSDDARVVGPAALIAYTFIVQRVDLGEDVRGALVDAGARVPAATAWTSDALNLLDSRGEQ